MKKLFTFLVLSIVTALSFAGNSYCDSKKTQTEALGCYANAVKMQNHLINQIVLKVYASPKLSDADKKYLSDGMQDWIQWVNNTCENNVCMYNEMVEMRQKIVTYYAEYIN